MFRVSLPLCDDAPTAIAVPAATDALLARRRVLVVEDDADSRAALIGLLRAWGCSAFGRSVNSARQRLAGVRARAVLADLRLAGGGSGIEAALAVRTALGKGLPALLVTGDVGDAQAQRAETAGLCLLAKPVKPMQLRAFLGQAFGT